MDDFEEIKNLLKKNLAVSQENLGLLRSIRRATWIGRIFRILYWSTIIFFMVVSYYYLQPIISDFQEIYQNAKPIIQESQKLLDIKN